MSRTDDALEPRLRVAPMKQSPAGGSGSVVTGNSDSNNRTPDRSPAAAATNEKAHPPNGGIDAGLKSLDHCVEIHFWIVGTVALLTISQQQIVEVSRNGATNYDRSSYH